LPKPFLPLDFAALAAFFFASAAIFLSSIMGSREEVLKGSNEAQERQVRLFRPGPLGHYS
jgi:hypothetical protein